MKDMDWAEKYILLNGDARETLSQLDSESIDCCVTSPPYYALRDYGYDGQIGLEKSPDEYISRLVEVFREVNRVLKPEGTLWINIGDSYWGSGSRGFDFTNSFTEKSKVQMDSKGTINLSNLPSLKGNCGVYKDKDLIGIPWMLAFALRADGWYLRQDIVWAKPNCMPESVTDRCTKSHEYVFLFSKSKKYYFDNKAIQEDCSAENVSPNIKFGGNKYGENSDAHYATYSGNKYEPTGRRNKRDVWSVPTSAGYTDGDGAHYATYSPQLVEPCVLAGCPFGGVVLDPFNGTGTTGVVAVKNGRKYIGIDLSEKYIELSTRRLEAETAQYTLFDGAFDTIHVC